MITLPERLTIGEAYGPAMKIETQQEADEYFEALVQHSMKHHGKSREEAIQLNKSNLGYYAGYYDDETRRRVEKLFMCEHPIFGSLEKNGVPSADDAFRMGLEMGKKEDK